MLFNNQKLVFGSGEKNERVVESGIGLESLRWAGSKQSASYASGHESPIFKNWQFLAVFSMVLAVRTWDDEGNMRIAYLTQSYRQRTGDVQPGIEGLTAEMSARGHQVLVITVSDKDHPYHIYKENLTIMQLRSIQNPLHANRRILVFQHFETMRALKRFKPDEIHAQHLFQAAWVGFVYARAAGISCTWIVDQLA